MLACAPQAGAQETAAAGAAPEVTPASSASLSVGKAPAGQVYEPAYFDRFAPKTALEMVRDIPGFSLDGGEQRRGLGQGGANALINGRRVSGKNNNVIDALGRIGVENVVRIEILDGASLSIPGLTGQVANIVTAPKGLTGRWEWNPQFRADTRPVLARGEASVSGESGALSYTLGVHAYGGSGASVGPERVTDASGALIDYRDETGSQFDNVPGATGSLTWLGRAGEVLNLNASIEAPRFDHVETSYRTGPGLPDRTRVFDGLSDSVQGELGGDYEFPLAGGSLKLIGLYRQEDGEDWTRLLVGYPDGSPTEGAKYLSTYTSGERIARAEYAFPPAFGGDWQLAGEGAFNYFDISAVNQTLQPDGGFVQDGAADATRIEEKRAEVSLTHTRTLTKGLDLQVALSGEYSELSQSGANGLTREFVRPKGFVSLAWKASPDFDLNARFERKVGQLDFGDFAASNDLSNGIETSGNGELVPEQAWAIELEANRRMGAWGAVKVTLSAADVEDVVDQIPIYLCDGARVPGAADCAPPATLVRSQGVGNIDSAKEIELEIDGTLNFDPIGLKGAKLEFFTSFEESEVRDPLTGEKRRKSNEGINYTFAQFRHDIPNTDWAYGVGFETATSGARFTLTQRVRDTLDPGYSFVFVENKDVMGAKVHLQVLPHGTHENLRREDYGAGRDTPLNYVEYRERTFSNVVRLEVSRSF
ncbi:MAG: hypothetical protein R3C52_00515 [Hyphomonadaceae bacterium]